MPFCITPPVATECCMELLNRKLCFECGETMPSDPQFSREIQWANYFVVLILFIVGIWNTISFIRIYQNNNNYISIMRLGNTLYAFGTGIFGICRIHFQFGKPLLVFAAIHNLCEWIFVAYAFYRNRKQREHVIFGTIIYIFTVIGVVLLMIPTFPLYALAEQVTGISLDFMLPIVWFILWRKNSLSKTKKNNDKKKAVQTGKDKETVKEESKLGYTYFVALLAHLVHILFTILPLVVVNFIRDQNEMLSRIIEFLIFLSVPATHILYTKFTDLFEENIDLPSIRTGKDYPSQTSVNLPSKLCIKKKQLIQQVFRMLFWYLLCIGIGIFPTIIIPKILPKCEVNVAVEPVVAEEPDVVSSSCPVQTGEAVTTDYNIAGNDFIIGTSTAHIYDGMSESFEYYLKSKNLVENARNFEGNIFFYLNKDMFKPNTYYIVEAWESKEAVQKWMKDPKDRAVWNNKTYNMLKGGKLEINGYLPLNPPYKLDKNIGKGAIRHIFKPFNGCDDIGEKMLNVSNCEWIMNCDHVEVLNEEKREQILVFKSGWRLHCFAPEPKKIIEGDKITYSMIHQCENGITELFQFSADPSQYPQDECHGLLRFDVDLNIKTVDEVYDMYNFGNIPHVQKTYQLSDPSLVNDCDNDEQNKSALCEM